MNTEQQRIVRIPMRPALIRQIDEIVQQRLAGYESRSELVVDALEAFVLELTHPIDEGSSSIGPVAIAPGKGEKASSPPVPAWPTVQAPSRGSVLTNEAEAPKGPLFGLHNRDFPSIWALSRLALATRHTPVSADDFLVDIGAEAWDFAARVASVHPEAARTALALFPRNEKKRYASEESFVNFAIGGIRSDGEQPEGYGPLFVWGAVAVDMREGHPVVAPTESGYALLEDLDGLSLEQPHDRLRAEAFLDHLARHAPEDLWGFREAIAAIDSGIDRPGLVKHFSDLRPEWGKNVAATNAAGYLARCREWGLVKPRQHEGSYLLTEYGLDMKERTQ